jgi:hypothetical protein
MPTELEEVADVIVSDWDGAGYIKDPDILASFLGGKFKPLEEGKTTLEVAKLILDDFRGPGRYKNTKDLTEFLKGKIGLR